MENNNKRFLEIYNQCHDYVKKYVLDNFLNLNFLEIINDAYIELAESGADCDLFLFKKACKKIIGKHRNSISGFSLEIQQKCTSKFCKCCKEDKPMSAFGISVRSTGRITMQTYCYECMRNKMSIYNTGAGHKISIRKYQQSEKYKAQRKKCRSTEMAKIKNREYQRRFQQKKKENNG